MSRLRSLRTPGKNGRGQVNYADGIDKRLVALFSNQVRTIYEPQ
jgi:hypothetical protein